ncbi:MAG: AAA family ATPase [Clostridia bacterium]|nr:AAA family ATPase [Clostridia bacterium]
MSFYVFDTNKKYREILFEYIKENCEEKNIHLFENYNEGVEAIKSDENSPVVFIDITEINQNTENLVEQIKLYTSKIVITSIDYSTDTIVKAMRLGAREFLTKPVIKEDLQRVVSMMQQAEYELETNTSKVISIYSNKGGIGKTTIATNLAYELAKTTRDKVLLVDLNLQLGDVSTFLNLQPSFDVSYVINNLLEKKEGTLLKVFEKYKDTNLYILSDPSYIEQSKSITPQQIESLFKALRKIFPYIIVDMSSNIDANSLKILDISDVILFTTIVNIPAIRNCQRCLNLFKSRRYPKDKVKVILNRFMDNDEITVEDVETAIDEKIYWKIPNNYFSIMDAINKGVTASEINSLSNIANSFKDLSSKISNDIVEQTIVKYRF